MIALRGVLAVWFCHSPRSSGPLDSLALMSVEEDTTRLPPEELADLGSFLRNFPDLEGADIDADTLGACLDAAGKGNLVEFAQQVEPLFPQFFGLGGEAGGCPSSGNRAQPPASWR